MGDQTLAMPDSEAVAIAALRTANVCGGRVYSTIPPTPTFPLVVAHRIGGIPPDKRKLDNAVIQLDVWAETPSGDDKADARDEADAARIALFNLESTIDSTYGAQVTCVEDQTGLQWLPDALSGRGRYILTISMYVQSSRGA